MTNEAGRTGARATGRRAGIPLAGCAVLALLCGGLRAQAPDGFVSLFDGTLNGWVVENADAGNIRIVDGVLRAEGPDGWLRSERRYQDFALRIEFRFVTPDADSGIFVRAAGDDEFLRGWPNNSYQVQVRNPSTPSRFPPVGGLFRHGMPPGETDFDAPAAERLSAATGVWQSLEVEVAGERLAARLNGTEVMRAGNISRASGYIGIQGEAGVVEYRAIAIRE
jgi:hypothetical protein